MQCNNGYLPRHRYVHRYSNAPCRDANEPFQDDDLDYGNLLSSCAPFYRHAYCQHDYFDPYLHPSTKINIKINIALNKYQKLKQNYFFIIKKIISSILIFFFPFFFHFKKCFNSP